MLIKKKMDNLEVTKRRLPDNILVLYIITILLILLGQFLGMLCQKCKTRYDVQVPYLQTGPVLYGPL